MFLFGAYFFLGVFLCTLLTHINQAFTAWVNGVLDKIHEKVNDITTDFSDGIRLIEFLELLSNKKIGKKLERDPKSRIHKIQNVYLAIQFTETLDVKPEGVSAEGKINFVITASKHPLTLFLDIVDCNKKLILGFLWHLYRKYRIAVIKEGGKPSHTRRIKFLTFFSRQVI